MVWLYIAIVLVMRIFQSVFNKINAKAVPKNTIAYLKYNIFYFGIASACALLLYLVELVGSEITVVNFGETLFYAVASGVGLAVACSCSLYALTSGTIVLDSLFGTAGLLVPAIASIFLYQEILTIWQWLFIVIFFIGAYLLVGNSKQIYGKFSLKTLLVLITSLLMNGLTMLMQTMFSRNVENGSTSLFSVLSFLSGVILLGVLLIILTIVYKMKDDKQSGQASFEEFTLFPLKETDKVIPKKNLFYALILAFAVFVINQLATISANLISPVILFAFINGGATIISALVGVFLFKEKLNIKGIIGIVIGIGSLLLIKLLGV